MLSNSPIIVPFYYKQWKYNLVKWTTNQITTLLVLIMEVSAFCEVEEQGELKSEK
jgi:hypothetical protein